MFYAIHNLHIDNIADDEINVFGHSAKPSTIVGRVLLCFVLRRCRGSNQWISAPIIHQQDRFFLCHYFPRFYPFYGSKVAGRSGQFLFYSQLFQQFVGGSILTQYNYPAAYIAFGQSNGEGGAFVYSTVTGYAPVCFGKMFYQVQTDAETGFADGCIFGLSEFFKDLFLRFFLTPQPLSCNG